uniref:Uncharacterized protein n=1 Tax=Cacopsylla melanoneura TaxID=428564 RepID=A0A8D8UHH4_9HEMI
MQNKNEKNIINLRSGHLKRKLGDVENEDGCKDKDEDKYKGKDKEECETFSKKCKKSKKKKRKKSKKSSKKKDGQVDEKENGLRNQLGTEGFKATNCDDISTKINPIFLWIEQKDSKIISVLCEDYDKRNRIRLSKIFDGRWTAVPRTDRLVKAIEKTKHKISPDNSSCENLVTKTNKSISSTKDTSETDTVTSEENQQGSSESCTTDTPCTCQAGPCSCKSPVDDEDQSEEMFRPLSEAKQMKQKVFLEESQNLINIVNNLMELLDGIKENRMKEKEEARMKRKQALEEEIVAQLSSSSSKRRRCDENDDKALPLDDATEENVLKTCDNESENVNNKVTPLNTGENLENEPNPDQFDMESVMSEEFKENKYIQYNIINKDVNSHVNKINIKLSYAKTNRKIYDNNDSPKNIPRRNSSADVYDFENEDQYSNVSYRAKNDKFKHSERRVSSESISKHNLTEEKNNEEKSSEEKLSVLEKLAKEKPLTNSFEASFRKFIIENESPCSSTKSNAKNNMFELDIRLPHHNKQNVIDSKPNSFSNNENESHVQPNVNDSTVKSNLMIKNENNSNVKPSRTLNIKTVQEINNSTLVKHVENSNKINYIIKDNIEPINAVHHSLAFQNSLTDVSMQPIIPLVRCDMNVVEDQIAPINHNELQPTHTSDKPINSLDERCELPKETSQLDKKETTLISCHKNITHRGKTITLEEFEHEFVANYDEMITEDESSDDDDDDAAGDDDTSSYASGHGHNGPGFDINLWNTNQSFDHNLNVIDDQNQLQIMKDKRLFDLYNRHKVASPIPILTNFGPIVCQLPGSTQNDKSCNLELHKRNLRTESEPDNFFEGIPDMNKQQLLHGTFLPDEEFIDLEKIQPDKILSEDMHQEHLHSICHSPKDLWEVENNTLDIKSQEIELNMKSQGIELNVKSQEIEPEMINGEIHSVPCEKIKELETNEEDCEVNEPVKADINVNKKEVCHVHENKINESSQNEENKLTQVTMGDYLKNKDQEHSSPTKENKKTVNKMKTKDNKLDSIINKIIINKNKEEKEHQLSEIKSTDQTIMPEVKQEINDVSEEIIDQINKSPILTLETDGYEFVNNFEPPTKLNVDKKPYGIDSFVVKTNIEPRKSTGESKAAKLINNLSVSSMIGYGNTWSSWNHSEHSVESIANEILNEFCDSNHSDFNHCNRLKHGNDVSNKAVKAWLECSNTSSADPVNLKTAENAEKKSKENAVHGDVNNKLHNTLKLPKETMIYPIPENEMDSMFEEARNEGNKNTANKVDITMDNIETSGDVNNSVNDDNMTIDLSVKTNTDSKEVHENKSNVGIIKIRKSSELFMNSEQTEPLDLGNHNNEKSVDPQKEEKKREEKSKEEITIKSLLTKNINAMHKEDLVTKSEKSKLLELLTTDSDDILLNQINESMIHSLENASAIKVKVPRENVKMSEFHSEQVGKPANKSIEHSEPIEQLKAILSNPNIIVPDPLLVPRSRLPALVTSPAREIPKLMSNIIDYNKMNNELLVISLNNLHKLIQTTDKDDEKLIYNQQLNYLKEQFSKINKTPNTTDQNLLSYLDSNNNNKDLLNNMFMGYNELLNPFIQPNIEASNPPAHNNVDNIMNMLMYKQYNEMYSNKLAKQNQMKDVMQSKEKDAYLRELYTLIQNTYPQYTPKEVFNTMQVIQKDMMQVKDASRTKLNTNPSSNNTVRDMIASHQNKGSYNNYQQAQKDAKLYQQTMHKREAASHAYQHSQEYINAQKKKQAPFVSPNQYSTSQNQHHKKPNDKMSKLNEMFALSQQHKTAPHNVNPYEKYYQQQQQQMQQQQQQQMCNPLLAANLNQQPSYYQPDLSLLSQYGNMGMNHAAMSNEAEQLKKIQEEYIMFQQQLQMQQQNYLNYQQMHQQANERNKSQPRARVSPQNHPRASPQNQPRASPQNQLGGSIRNFSS